MNKDLERYAREQLKQGLASCTEAQQMIFKRMYSHKNLDLPIDQAVDVMSSDRLDWALEQVQRTLVKKGSEEKIMNQTI